MIYEVLKCVAHVSLDDSVRYTVEYYLATDNHKHYGIKTITYRDSKVSCTDYFRLNMCRKRVTELIELFSSLLVFPSTILDVIEDMKHARSELRRISSDEAV